MLFKQDMYPCRFFDLRHLRHPPHPRQNFIDPRDPRDPRQNLTHASHEPTLPTPPKMFSRLLRYVRLGGYDLYRFEKKLKHATSSAV